MADTDHERLQKRLNLIEAHVRGIARMIDDGRPANEICHQLRAVRDPLSSAAGVLAERHLIEQVNLLGDTKTEPRLKKRPQVSCTISCVWSIPSH